MGRACLCHTQSREMAGSLERAQPWDTIPPPGSPERFFVLMRVALGSQDGAVPAAFIPSREGGKGLS